ncbi:mucin-5AC [Drosophila yakuba]|uniref:Folded gastrulation N-terminal domain-containing protein n=1 Tax=Drosophila yakuba TaxID=7245 RepID=B4NZM4_DROYA|nr:mucin-5AC [Drosophila yakuba]EDW87773.1 uncharacterized protein Dyak_GE18367 [Drosophila yakuba]
METIDPNTRIMMMLLLLWVLLVGPSVFGSPLEMQLLDMMLREAEDYPSNGRDQRDISVLPATSIGCDDSGDAQDPFSHIFEDYEESKEECMDLVPPCEPAFEEGLPIEHPCFVRLLLLRTPLHKQDPCANFTLVTEGPTTTVKPKTRKCNPKSKANKNVSQNELLALPNNVTINSTTSTPVSSTTETATDSKIIKIRKLVPKIKTNTTTSTTTTTLATTTIEESTSPAETSTTEVEAETTTEQETSSTTSSTTTSTTQPPFTENQLKRLRALRNRRKNARAKSPNVPDPPQIKLDNASQPSEVIQVIMTTEAAELKLQPEVNNTTTTVVPPTTVSTTTSGPETTTSESCVEEVESTTVPQFSGCKDDEGAERSDNRVTSTTEEPCEDTDEQDTNLCPQFMPTQGPSSPRPPSSYRFRKPVKNYVEPILYEGNFGKPLQQMAPVGPQQRDYFVSNKQIVPKPRPKYRKRIPPSIYMNNIVRGLDCSDEVGPYPPRTPNQPQRFWGVTPVGFLQRNQGSMKQQPERKMKSFAPVPIRRKPFYPRSSEETMERQYMMERDPEPRPQYHHYPEDEVVFHEDAPPSSPTPSLDPCQQEHDHVLFRQRPQHQHTDHLVDYPQSPISSHFFT